MYRKPFVGIIPDYSFTKENVESLLQYDTLRGVIVVNSTVSSSDNTFFSPAPNNPQGYGTPSSSLSISLQYNWNPSGQSLTVLDLNDVPIVYIQDADLSAYLLQVANDQTEKTYPAIVAEFNYYMGPSVTSTECLAWVDNDGQWRPKCLPLGGNSIWATAGSTLNEQENDDKKQVVMIAAAMDGTSFFHDLAPSANGAASNILTVLLASKLIGENMSNDVIDNLSKTIAFALFQGESFGFLGSRAFFRDTHYPGFFCSDESTAYYDAESGKGAFEKGENSCLQPLKPSLAFQKLGEIANMIAIDQVGVLQNDKTFYLHGENAGNAQSSSFVGNVVRECSSSYSMQSSSAVGENDDFYGDPLPPSPFTSLLRLSEGNVGGVVLTGYDDAFVNSRYESHLDNNALNPVDLNAIVSAATILARSAVALAYDGGNDDYEAAAQYAKNIIPELSSSDEYVESLANCLLLDGNCDVWRKYTEMERANERSRSGVDLGQQVSRGSPPSYYVNVYDASNGQAFVQVNNKWYGSYEGTDFGKNENDVILLRPTALEAGIHGMFNDFLGRGSVSDENNLKACSSTPDCSDINYCSGNDYGVCTGSGKCVCYRSHFHTALDEAITPASNNSTGKFLSNNDGNYDSSLESALYTEPYWAADVGVKVYRDAGDFGYWALFVGFSCSMGFAALSLFIKNYMKKEKLS